MKRFGLLLLLAFFGCDDGSGAEDSKQQVLDAAIGPGDVSVGIDGAALADAAAQADAALEADAAADMAVEPPLSATEPTEADVDFDWITAGQPTEARVREIVAAGVPIISLRYPEEDPFDEPGVVESLGGQFTRYPTQGADYDRVEFREAMYDLYDEHREAGGQVYLHCASSNRVGASWALYHAERLGLPAEEALQKGREAGLGSLEDRVRMLLGL